MRTPTTLKTLGQGRFRVVLDQTWKLEAAERRDARIWYEQIPTTGRSEDFINLYSLNPVILKFSSSRKKLAKIIWEKISHIPGAWADFVFDGEAILYFPPEAISPKQEGELWCVVAQRLDGTVCQITSPTKGQAVNFAKETRYKPIAIFPAAQGKWQEGDGLELLEGK